MGRNTTFVYMVFMDIVLVCINQIRKDTKFLQIVLYIHRQRINFQMLQIGSIKTNKRRFLCCFGGRYTTKSNEFAIDEKDKSFDCNETGETDLICRNGSSFNEYLLPPQCPLLSGRNSLVIDLDETLVHSSFKV
ncbi:hypothetical protein GJ496_004770 [Pomphorhynchus laevis]|nr:hypothetical protein GJ496_004770 [Pomphorhynchus laevis]